MHSNSTEQDGVHFHRGEYETLIKEIFQEELKKQADLVSGNFKLTMQEMHRLKNEIIDLGKSLEFAQNNLEDNLTELEDRSCQNNVRIDEIKDTKEEKWNDSEEKVQDVCTETGIGCYNRDSNTNRPQTIVLNLLQFKNKTKIF